MPAKPPAPAPDSKPPRTRKAVDKLPAKSVRVRLPTRQLSILEAEALAFVARGEVPADHREVAWSARNAVKVMADEAIDEGVVKAVTVYRKHQHDTMLAEAEQRHAAAAAEVERLRSEKPAAVEAEQVGDGATS